MLGRQCAPKNGPGRLEGRAKAAVALTGPLDRYVDAGAALRFDIIVDPDSAERKLAAILSADVAGYSRLMARE